MDVLLLAAGCGSYTHKKKKKKTPCPPQRQQLEQRLLLVVQLLPYCCAVGYYGCGTVAALENQRTSWLRVHLRAARHTRDFIPN